MNVVLKLFFPAVFAAKPVNKGHTQEQNILAFVGRWLFNLEVNFYINWTVGIQAFCLCSQVGLYLEVTINTGLIYLT